MQSHVAKGARESHLRSSLYGVSASPATKASIEDPEVSLERMGSVLYIHQPSSLYRLSPLRIQVPRIISPSNPSRSAVLSEPSARSLLQTKLKIQRKVGTCSGVINKFTQKVDTRACGLRVPRAIMASQTGFGSPTFAPDLPEGLCCEPTGPSKLISNLPRKGKRLCCD